MHGCVIHVEQTSSIGNDNSDDDLTSPVDFESVSPGRSTIHEASFGICTNDNQQVPLPVDTEDEQVARVQESLRPVFLDLPTSHQVFNGPPPPYYSELSPRTLQPGYPGPPPSPSNFPGFQWKWVGGVWSPVLTPVPPEEPWIRQSRFGLFGTIRSSCHGDLFLWTIIIFLFGIIGCLTYKHLELLKIVQSMNSHQQTTPTNFETSSSQTTFASVPLTKASNSSPVVEVVEMVEVGSFPSYYVEYVLFFLGVAAILLAVCRDVCRRNGAN